jgi:hypothetical protein
MPVSTKVIRTTSPLRRKHPTTHVLTIDVFFNNELHEFHELEQMKLKMILAACLMSTAAVAQTDPIVMTVAGVPVPRSEFEYS